MKNKDLIALTKQAVFGQEADTMVPFAALPKYAQDKLRSQFAIENPAREKIVPTDKKCESKPKKHGKKRSKSNKPETCSENDSENDKEQEKPKSAKK